MEITSQSKLLDVLEAHPVLEEQIIHIAPPFKNLKNPVLRRTVGKLATLEQVARIGGMDVGKLVNTLRRAVGQEELGDEALTPLHVDVPTGVDDPDWIGNKPQFTLDGTVLLKHGEVPLGRVNELLGQLNPDGFILLVTDFEPSPILEAMQKQKRRVHHKVHPDHPGQHLTYIQ